MLELTILAAMQVGLVLYALFGGADFGGGVWEFNTAMRAPEKERDLIYRAIGPVWEANHVWLIFVVVALFSAFPPAFAAISRALWVPLLLAIVGIVFRGVGFAFRSHAAGHVHLQEIWGAVFAFASTAAPFFLGAAAGAIASGKLAVASDGSFTGSYLTGWISPISIFSAFFAVGICAYIAAVYLAREADGDLAELWRRRAILTGLWMGFLAAVGLVIMALDTPILWKAFKERSWPAVIASGLAGYASLGALWKRQYLAATIGASATVATVVLGLGLALYPALVPPAITVESAKAPDAVLKAMIVTLGVGAALVFPSLAWLIILFKGKRVPAP